MTDTPDQPIRQPRRSKADGDDGGGLLRRDWRKLVKPSAIAVGAFAVALVPWWGPKILRHMDFFHVRHVEVVGTKYISADEVLARMNVDTNMSVWDPTDSLRERVRSHPLVSEVTVDYKLPGTLVVRVIEHAPVALVPGADGFVPYDARSFKLPIDPTMTDVDVPILSAPDTSVLKLLGVARTQTPGLFRRLSEVRLVGMDEITFVVDSLPVRTTSGVTLQRLTDLEVVERDLARRHLRAIELDLRYRDQIIARLQ